jgi:hypothetical protein
MILHSTRNCRRGERGELTIFDLFCFIAACAVIVPAARWVSHYFPEHSRAVFCIIMLTVYPVVGLFFVFCCTDYLDGTITDVTKQEVWRMKIANDMMPNTALDF